MSTALKTRCPHCRSAFRITGIQLNAASGTVRCGVCFKTFNARDNLEKLVAEQGTPAAEDDDLVIDDNFDLSRLEELVSGDVTQIDAPPKTPTIEVPETATKQRSAIKTATPSDREAPVFATIPAGGIESSLTVADADMANWRAESESIIDPDDGPQELSDHHRRNWLWISGSTVALIVLCGQLIYFNSLGVSRDSPLWPTVSFLCQTIGCPLQPRVDTKSIVSGELLVRTHPTVANALLVDAVIINQSSFSQPFPKLTLSFEDLQGNVVAQRTFLPNEYLQGELSNTTLMPGNRPIKLEMEIVDPGKNAVSFRLMVEK